MAKVKKNVVKEPFKDRIFLVGVYLFLAIVLLIVLLPLINIVSSSLSTPKAVVSGQVWLFPVDFSIEGYKAVFNNPNILTGFRNSLFYTVVGTFVNVVLTIMVAYPLSRSTFYGRNLIMMLLVFTMLFDGGLIPYYLVVKDLGLLNTPWAMILPGAVAVFQVIIARTFFQTTIPSDLSEAAEMDGCSDLRFISKIVLPLSKPIIAVMSLMYAVGHWNAYFEALIFLRDPNLYPLQIVLREILVLNTIDPSMLANVDQAIALAGLREQLKYALIVVASVPVLLIYPFVQRHFTKGVMIGSLKG